MDFICYESPYVYSLKVYSPCLQSLLDPYFDILMNWEATEKFTKILSLILKIFGKENLSFMLSSTLEKLFHLECLQRLHAVMDFVL